MKVDIVERQAVRTAAARHIGPYSQISEAFERLGGLAGPAGLFGLDATMMGLYYDDPTTTPEGELRSDAALSIAAGAKIPAGLAEQIVPAGKYARTRYIGPYTGLPDAWDRLMSGWFPSSGHSVGGGASFEEYLNDPTNTPPEKLITDIYVPLQ